MAILVPRWLDFSWQVRLQMCLKIRMVKFADCMGSPNEQYDFEDIVLFVGAPHTICDFYHTNFRHACSRTCQLKSSHLGTRIAITSPIFTFRS